MALSFDPDFQSDAYNNGAIGLLEIGESGIWPIPAGAAGDTLVLWMMCEQGWSTGEFPTVLSITQEDSTEAPGGSLSIVHEIVLDDTVTLYVATGTRIADLYEIEVLFGDVSGPAGWVIGNFPAGTFAEAGAEALTGDADTFTPTGEGIFAGAVISAWSPDASAPGVTAPDSNFASDRAEVACLMRAFAYESGDTNPVFSISMPDPDDYLIYAYALLLSQPTGRWRTGRVGWAA